MDFAVGEALRSYRAQIRRLGVKVLADFRLRVAIFSMAARTVVDEKVLSFLHYLGSGGPRVLFTPRTAWYPQIPHSAGDNTFNCGGLIRGAEAAPYDCNSIRDNQQHEDKNRKAYIPPRHAFLPLETTSIPEFSRV